jgi:hypothetical protein
MAKRKPKMTADEKFFFEHGGSSYDPKRETKAEGRRRGAEEAARAMKIAEERGWQFVWEEDPEPYNMGDAETEMPREVLMLRLDDENGNVLASLGGIGFSGSVREDRDQGRVFESELAMEAAHHLGLLQQTELPFRKR